MDIQILVYGIIFFSGVWSSYTDIRYRKIKNTCVLFTLVSGILINVFLFPSKEGIMGFMINSGLSLFSIIIIWWAGFWSAADAKLFWAYSTLVPISFYQNSYIRYFSTMNIFVNTFIPVFIFLVLQTIIKTTFKQKIKTLRRVLSLRSVFHVSLALFSIGFLRRTIFKIIKIPESYFTDIFLLFVVLDVIERILKIRPTLVYIMLFVLGALFQFDQMITLGFWVRFAEKIIIFTFLRFFIIYLAEHIFLKPVKIEELKEGMHPSEIILKTPDGKFVKQGIIYSSVLSLLRRGKKDNIVFGKKPDGLTKEDVEWLKNIHRSKKVGFDSISVHSTIPFAPFLFLGVLSVMLCHGNIFSCF